MLLSFSNLLNIFDERRVKNHAELSFTISSSSVKIDPSVKSRSVDANLTLSIDYP